MFFSAFLHLNKLMAPLCACFCCAACFKEAASSCAGGGSHKCEHQPTKYQTKAALAYKDLDQRAEDAEVSIKSKHLTDLMIPKRRHLSGLSAKAPNVLDDHHQKAKPIAQPLHRT